MVMKAAATVGLVVVGIKPRRESEEALRNDASSRAAQHPCSYLAREVNLEGLDANVLWTSSHGSCVAGFVSRARTWKVNGGLRRAQLSGELKKQDVHRS